MERECISKRMRDEKREHNLSKKSVVVKPHIQWGPAAHSLSSLSSLQSI
jgi:hypothetical protein